MANPKEDLNKFKAELDRIRKVSGEENQQTPKNKDGQPTTIVTPKKKVK